ncbi:LOW QUALITY PROTEIN: melanin-concentrating hormone receptor 2 [Chlamydotis macqueenii]
MYSHIVALLRNIKFVKFLVVFEVNTLCKCKNYPSIGTQGRYCGRIQKKTIPDIYTCNLAIADLVHVIDMPFLIHQWTRGKWVFGSSLCSIITSLDICSQFTCSAIMTTMSLDRYLTLIQPFRLRTRSKTIVNLCLWVASLVLIFPVWVYSKVIMFRDSLESCTFDLTSPGNVLWYMLYLTITTLFFPLPLVFICYILIYERWELYQQNKKAEIYTTSIPRQRVMRLIKMVLICMFVVSAAPFHVIQLMNLQVSQPTLTFYVSYYMSVCLSYASSSINPFLHILLSGNFEKHLWWYTNMEVRMAEWDINIVENTLKSSFGKDSLLSRKMHYLCVDFIACNRWA